MSFTIGMQCWKTDDFITNKEVCMKRSMSGFTLIELMVTLVIISVVVGMATLSFGKNPAKELEREAARLQLMLQNVSDEAVLQGIEFALAIPGNTYQFLYYDVKELSWFPMAGKDYEAYPLPDYVALSIAIDGESIDQEMYDQIQSMTALSADESLQPVLLLLSSGETTPFRITFNLTAYDDGIDRGIGNDGAIQSVVSSDGVSGIFLQ